MSEDNFLCPPSPGRRRQLAAYLSEDLSVKAPDRLFTVAALLLLKRVLIVSTFPHRMPALESSR